MSLYTERHERLIVEAKPRAHDPETLDERDRKVIETLAEGKTVEVTARIFRIVPKYVEQIRRRVPGDIQAAIERDVADRRQRLLSSIARDYRDAELMDAS